jgi:capsular exopolysaccharide synthesis family protein
MATSWLGSSKSTHNGTPRPIDELVSFNAPGSLEADQYRTLRHVVERLSLNAELKVIAVTSPAMGDGKTVTTLNLAGSLAQSPGTRVLVIDADLHRPAVASNLGLAIDDGHGLEDALDNRDASRAARATQRIESLNLSVLLPGSSSTPPYQVLGSPHVGSLLTQLRGQYDYVLIDTPPAAPLADVRMLARWVDGFIVVVSAHRTARKQLVEALGALDRDKVIGVVFNGDDQPMRSSHYGYYAVKHSRTTAINGKVPKAPKPPKSSGPPSITG